jgi:diguanylate cyclase (GGDEF)-like protein/PAS domain S-box-containing protein
MENSTFYKNILDNVFDGIYMVDRERRITYWNKGAERITGFKAESVLGKKCADNILNHINEKGELLCLNGCPLQATILDGQPHEMEVYLHHAQGHRLPVAVHAEPITDEHGNIIGAVETFTDNSMMLSIENKAHELQQLVDRDALTGLGSRQDILNRLEISLVEMRTLHTKFGLLYMDLDHFKNINDVFGHENGDKVLKMVANSIRHSLRSGDEVGRLGGEEFLAIIRDADEKKLKTVAEKLRIMILNSLIAVEEQLLQISVSIGATMLKMDDTSECAIQRADEMMYNSKKMGRNRVTIDQSVKT